MKQRMVFAAAIFADPPVLILDEPPYGLDPRYAKLIREWIGTLRSLRTTILMSTHIIPVAESLFDRVGIMHMGRLWTVGTLDEILKITGCRNLEDAFVHVAEMKMG